MKKFLLIFFFMFTSISIVYAIEVWENTVSKKTGETIKISWGDPHSANYQGFVIYRTVGLTGTPSKVATLGPDESEWITTIPAGNSVQYRFFVRMVDSTGSVGPSGVEVIVNRKK